ncbi:MAG: hypothetical protein EP312_02850 [Gammaproteobacteria bacterium]|nr:MAG: hypothetical protein EP312_02850 [Gammaproteobacteria bacterium]
MRQDVLTHLRKDITINGVSNAVFNGLAAWPTFKGIEALPFWGNPGMALDIAATATILVFIVTLILVPVARMKRRKGKLPPFQWDERQLWQRFFQRFPQGLLARACCYALIGLLVIAPLSWLPYLLLDINSLPGTTYAIVKGVWAGVIAAIICIPILLTGMADPLPANAE